MKKVHTRMRFIGGAISILRSGIDVEGVGNSCAWL